MHAGHESNMRKALKICLYVNVALAVALSLYLFLLPAALILPWRRRTGARSPAYTTQGDTQSEP